jgi:hypothetical protein
MQPPYACLRPISLISKSLGFAHYSKCKRLIRLTSSLVVIFWLHLRTTEFVRQGVCTVLWLVSRVSAMCHIFLATMRWASGVTLPVPSVHTHVHTKHYSARIESGTGMVTPEAQRMCSECGLFMHLNDMDHLQDNRNSIKNKN